MEPASGPWLVATVDPQGIPTALAKMAALHAREGLAEPSPQPCANQEEAQRRAKERGCRGVIWLA